MFNMKRGSDYPMGYAEARTGVETEQAAWLSVAAVVVAVDVLVVVVVVTAGHGMDEHWQAGRQEGRLVHHTYNM